MQHNRIEIKPETIKFSFAPLEISETRHKRFHTRKNKKSNASFDF